MKEDSLSEEMYKEQILELYKHPLNHGELKNETLSHKEHNPLCGDEIKIMLKIDKGRVADVMFNGQGCAISQASASLLTDEIKGKTLEEVKKFDKKKLFKLLGIPLSPVRMKCALLSLDTLKNTIKIYEEYKK